MLHDLARDGICVECSDVQQQEQQQLNEQLK
jgi:hypothetical protein